MAKWDAVQWNTILVGFNQPKEVLCVLMNHPADSSRESTYNRPKKLGYTILRPLYSTEI